MNYLTYQKCLFFSCFEFFLPEQKKPRNWFLWSAFKLFIFSSNLLALISYYSLDSNSDFNSVSGCWWSQLIVIVYGKVISKHLLCDVASHFPWAHWSFRLRLNLGVLISIFPSSKYYSISIAILQFHPHHLIPFL